MTTATKSFAVIDHSTSGQAIAVLIDRIKLRPAGLAAELLPFLSERHHIYGGRSAGETIRIRGYAMAAFEQTGLPDRALPYVLESLESEFHPYLVAAAACALRGMKQPHPAIGAYLITAAYNIRTADKPVSFASYDVEWPQKEFSTGLVEIFTTLASFGAMARSVLPDLERLNEFVAFGFSDRVRLSLAAAITAIRNDDRVVAFDCCGLQQMLQPAGEKSELMRSGRVSAELVIQDQNGSRLKWAEFFCQKPSVLAFFYTRCGNPRKCTQTIFNLAHIRDELERMGLAGRVRVAAITYDPQFDTPESLNSFGKARKFRFNADSRMFRVPDDFSQVVRAFSLGVNFSGTQVNSHRIEFYLLNETGDVVRSFVRLQTEPQQVVDAVIALFSRASADPPNAGGPPCQSPCSEGRPRRLFHSASSLILGLLMAFFPKCPFCWVSYISLLGIAGAESIPYSPWLVAVIVVLLAINLYSLHLRAAQRNGYAPVFSSVLGSVFLFMSVPYFGLPRWLMIPGIGFLLGGSLLQALSYPIFNKIKWFFYEFKCLFVRKSRKNDQTLILSPKPCR